MTTRNTLLMVSLAVGIGMAISMLGLLSAQAAPPPSALAVPDAAPAAESGATWVSETVDGGNGDYVGKYTSLALDGEGAPHMSYYDESNLALKYAHWDNSTSTWVSETVDGGSGQIAGLYTSLALEPTAPYTPHISYYDHTNSALKHAYLGASGWVRETADSVSGVLHTSLALASTPPYTPHISYYDQSDRDLKYAYWDNSASTWVRETVDSEGDVGYYASLALASTAPYTPHISYWDYSNRDLKYAYLGASGWVSETVDSEGNVGDYTSLALESTAPYTPHISYYDNADDNKNLKYAYLGDSGWVSGTVDGEGNVGEHSSLALDADDVPHVSYFDNDNGDLKYATMVGDDEAPSADSVTVGGYVAAPRPLATAAPWLLLGGLLGSATAAALAYRRHKA